MEGGGYCRDDAMASCAARPGLPKNARGRLGYVEDDGMAEELATGLWGGYIYGPVPFWIGLRKTDPCGTQNTVSLHLPPSPPCPLTRRPGILQSRLASWDGTAAGDKAPVFCHNLMVGYCGTGDRHLCLNMVRQSSIVT